MPVVANKYFKKKLGGQENTKLEMRTFSWIILSGCSVSFGIP